MTIQINPRDLPDVKDDVKVGDFVAAIWFDELLYYSGFVAENEQGELVIQTRNESEGLVSFANHVVMIRRGETK